MYNSWVEISRSAILHNLLQFKKIVGKNAEIMPIIKSNAYGHGMVEVAKIVSPKVKWLGVVSLGEALELRKQGIKNKIFVLSYAQSLYLKQGIKQGIDLPIYDLIYAKLISKVAAGFRQRARVHIKIDTGTARVGIQSNDAVEFIKTVRRLPNIKVVGLYSHFASAEDNSKYTNKQLRIFDELIGDLKKEGIEIPFRHIACSAAVIVEPKARYNMVRLGLSLYGLWPSEEVKIISQKKYPSLQLKPALTWKTKIIQVKNVLPGSKIGYGCSFMAKQNMKIAVLAAGYWEGYDRHLSNRGQVLIKNKKCPVVGRICMNLMMTNVSKIKNIKAGDDAILLGQPTCRNFSEGGGISTEDLAEKIGTINYEVITRINPLLPRIIIK